ncbi:MAG: hypothetical protein JSS30_02630 [Verrucomicrobia bacterium]|nr:hypothetical protein [Verrucomicrobiota bacterium]
MAGICDYVPTQTLSNWCSNIDLTGSRAGIALSIIVIIVLAKLQTYNDYQEQPIQPLDGRVQIEDLERLRLESRKLSEFLSDAFMNPDSKHTVARGFIKNPSDILGPANNPVRTQELWKLLLRMTFSTFVREQFESIEQSSSRGVQFSEPSQDVYVDFMGLLEAIDRGPRLLWDKIGEFGKDGKLKIVNGFLTEMEKLQGFLNGLDGENFSEKAHQIYAADIVNDLRDYLIRNDLDKGKEDFGEDLQPEVQVVQQKQMQQGPARQSIPEMIPVK